MRNVLRLQQQIRQYIPHSWMWKLFTCLKRGGCRWWWSEATDIIEDIKCQHAKHRDSSTYCSAFITLLCSHSWCPNYCNLNVWTCTSFYNKVCLCCSEIGSLVVTLKSCDVRWRWVWFSLFIRYTSCVFLVTLNSIAIILGLIHNTYLDNFKSPEKYFINARIICGTTYFNTDIETTL